MSFDSTASLNVSDPQARYVSISCLDLLLIELVPMAERIARDLELGISVKPTSASSPHSAASVSSSSPSSPSSSSASSPNIDESKDKVTDTNKEEKDNETGKEGEKEKSSAEIDEEELREATYFRLEALGYRVGVGLAERYVHHFLRITSLRLGCGVFW